MARQELAPIKRTIRRHQLREIVPLADSTIYEMERHGLFPRRFALSARCIVWDLVPTFPGKFAVGTLITKRPPHNTVRAAFPHTAPTLGG